ncbi:MAG: endonuclease domain-containing protein [Ignavibacteria bacterium]|nr:endonuclease domain-containing protein [Ignavibacteria bacterium]
MKKRRRQLRKTQTPAEVVLWEYLRNKQLDGFKFRRQHSIGRYVVDFYCPARRLAIEIDGSIHRLKKIKRNDAEKAAFLHSLRIGIIRFSNWAVLHHLDAVLNALRQQLKSEQ